MRVAAVCRGMSEHHFPGHVADRVNILYIGLEIRINLYAAAIVFNSRCVQAKTVDIRDPADGY